jgi:hypothetical protein
MPSPIRLLRAEAAHVLATIPAHAATKIAVV